MKAPKKAPNKPPRHGVALVPFKKIGDAFAAVCASGREERGLKGVEVTWVGGKEPMILGWLKKKGLLGPTSAAPGLSTDPIPGTIKTGRLPQEQTSSKNAGAFSSFPDTFVRLHLLAFPWVCN
jgi:DnaJ homolog subfamily C member 17